MEQMINETQLYIALIIITKVWDRPLHCTQSWTCTPSRTTGCKALVLQLDDAPDHEAVGETTLFRCQAKKARVQATWFYWFYSTPNLTKVNKAKPS